MGDHFFGKVRGRVAATSVSTSGGVSVTIAAPSDTARHYAVTGIQTSSDAACLVTIESPASTVLWRKRYAAAHAASESFPPGVINGAVGAAVIVKTSASTSNTEGNIQALTV
jgi:hypothetical protein